ncbi:uncharacterized protein LOC112177447 [Rosa chinensis]|uniref:uncharacterized protein LOC112177447 n=1 Tax=Rosa chinensis TaxID=74649 RepID=UPI001AD8C20B|nr:uncharacterized protein LOC112177447 [Rosa chinensis]
MVQKASTSSAIAGGHLRWYWTKIWYATVPPKVKIFIWRLLHGAIPTRSALSQRKVQLHDLNCVLCQSSIETVKHVFKDCDALQCFWSFSPLKLCAKTHAAPNIKEWILDLLDVLTSEQVDLFFMALWAIWTERNNLVWKGGSFQPIHMIQWCIKSLEDFQQYHPKATRKKKRPMTKWQCPPQGRLKINIDGAFRADCGIGGIGVVVRDELGTGIAAIARPFLHAHSAINMEAEACRAGLLLGIHQGWTEIDIESDSALLIAALNSEEENFSELESDIFFVKQMVLHIDLHTLLVFLA